MTDQSHNDHTGKGSVAQVPLHRRIAETLTKQVTRGLLKPGQKLPSERRIADQFSASRATVRTALQHLEQAGLITRRDRRSAIVSIRRDIKPYLRMACGQGRLLNILRQMGDLQLLPPRCQLQQLDLQQPGIVRDVLAQPTSGADILFCDLEFVRHLRSRRDIFTAIPPSLIGDAALEEPLGEIYGEEGRLQAVPFTVSPMVLYYNRAIFYESQLGVPEGGWSWEALLESARRCTGDGRYGFQIRPTYGHLSTLMSHRGGCLYDRDGTVASLSSGTFEESIRFLYDLLHGSRVSPVLAKVEQINLFAQRRCGMALDGFEMYRTYREQLGDDLGVGPLPGTAGDGRITTGFVGMVLAGQETLQPSEDLLRALMNLKAQLVLAEQGAGLPVRSDLLNPRALEEIGIPSAISELFLSEAGDFRPANQPAELEHKQAVENLFLELWLDLDNPDSLCERFRHLAQG